MGGKHDVGDRMKKWIIFICSLMLVLSMSACGNASVNKNKDAKEQNFQQDEKDKATEPEVDEGENDIDNTVSDSRILVVNFSCTGKIKPIAEKVASYLNADFYEIVPAVPYTDKDINYHDDNCRANKEQADDSARPEIEGEKIDVKGYDTVIISFPIWWGMEPRIIDTFMETYDFSGKTLTCFCTSGSSGISTAEINLQAYVPNGTWLDGIRFNAGVSDAEIYGWVDSIGVKPAEKVGED